MNPQNKFSSQTIHAIPLPWVLLASEKVKGAGYVIQLVWHIFNMKVRKGEIGPTDWFKFPKNLRVEAKISHYAWLANLKRLKAAGLIDLDISKGRATRIRIPIEFGIAAKRGSHELQHTPRSEAL